MREEYKKLSARSRGTNSDFGNASDLLENGRPKYHESIVNQKLQHLNDIISVYFFLRQSQCSSKYLPSRHVTTDKSLKTSIHVFFSKIGIREKLGQRTEAYFHDVLNTLIQTIVRSSNRHKVIKYSYNTDVFILQPVLILKTAPSRLLNFIY